MLVQGAIALGRVAIAGQAEGGVGAGKGFGVQQACTLALVALTDSVGAGGLGDIRRERTDGRVLRGAQIDGTEIRRPLHAAEQGGVIGRTIRQPGDAHHGCNPVVAIAVVLPHAQVVAKRAAAHHLRQGRECLGGHPAAAVSLDHGNFKIAVGAVGVDVVNHKGAGGHGGAVQQVVVLAHLDGCIGVGITPDNGGITAQAVWQHGVIGCQSQAFDTNAVEDLRTGEGLAQGQLALQ